MIRILINYFIPSSLHIPPVSIPFRPKPKPNINQQPPTPFHPLPKRPCKHSSDFPLRKAPSDPHHTHTHNRLLPLYSLSPRTNYRSSTATRTPLQRCCTPYTPRRTSQSSSSNRDMFSPSAPLRSCCRCSIPRSCNPALSCWLQVRWCF